MPYSADEGKYWTREHVERLAPKSILDIGPGAGTYAMLLRQVECIERFSCIEIYEPYVDRFRLHNWYDEVIVGDAMELDWQPADVVILGDVLEHVSYDNALVMWDKARKAANKAVILSLPIIEYPQGCWEGNEHEAHLHTWDHDLVLSSLEGIDHSWTGVELGVYVAETK